MILTKISCGKYSQKASKSGNKEFCFRFSTLLIDRFLLHSGGCVAVYQNASRLRLRVVAHEQAVAD